MEKPLPGQPDYLDASIKTAQYLARLTTQQDIWSETGKVLVSFFGADMGAFGTIGEDGEIASHHWTFSEKFSSGRDLEAETREAIAEVLESGFLTLRIIFTPGPLSIAYLPITMENQVIAVMLVGHGTAKPLPKELLNVYLAVAGLVGTTAMRLASELELREHRRHLEQLVKKRTAELTKVNEDLQQEITERKRAEEALRIERDNLIAIFEAMEDVVYIANAQGDIQYGNSALEKEFGRYQGRKCYEFLESRREACPWCHIHDVVAGKTVRWEWYSSKSDKIYDVIETPLRNANETVKLTLLRDISERKRAEEEKEKTEAQNRQLQKAESLSRMAGAIAHHFNNQLAAVMGNLELAMIHLPHGARPHANITAAMQAAHRAVEVSGLMLTYLGQTAGKHEPLDLSEICRRSLPMLRAAMPKEVALETDLPSLGPAISANANQIQQVLTSLATNAWEAFGDGRGAIHLRIKTVSSTDIPTAHRFPIDWQPQDHAYACLEVADAGCGIADHDLEKLFDPFFSSKFTGRGLGLSVVLGIVRAHGGAVTVASEPGRGSVFRVFFPVSAEEVPRQQPDKVARAPELERGDTVMLVEDEEMLRNMAEAMLTRLGFTVLTAKDGVEALEVFRQHRDTIRCVLCDLTMPRMDGWETLAALRELQPDISVVLSSGYDEARVMQGHHMERPQAFLHKPYQMKDLEAALGAARKASPAANKGAP